MVCIIVFDYVPLFVIHTDSGYEANFARIYYRYVLQSLPRIHYRYRPRDSVLGESSPNEQLQLSWKKF